MCSAIRAWYGWLDDPKRHPSCEFISYFESIGGVGKVVCCRASTSGQSALVKLELVIIA